MPISCRLLLTVWTISCVSCCAGPSDDDPEPLMAEQRQALLQPYEDLLQREPTEDSAPSPELAVRTHSQRGDALFFLGRYSEAVDAYRGMITLRPELESSHWRLGIALSFAGKPAAAARQFDRYHTYDDVDRENGIWRFLCHYQASGRQKAQQELLRYTKDDRPPFPIVYRLFDGSLTPAEAVAQIPDSLSAIERDQQLFYTELYIGLLQAVEGKRQAALQSLRSATSRRWPRTAGYGPHYMWHVGRLRYEQLAAEPAGATIEASPD